jgi:hypothetical protein
MSSAGVRDEGLTSPAVSVGVDSSLDGSERTSQRRTALLVIAALLETAVIILLGTSGDTRFYLEPNFISIGFLGTVLLFPVMGALIVQRRPSTRVAWLMILLGLGLGFGIITAAYGVIGQPSSSTPWRSLPFATESLLLSQLFFVPALAGATTFILLLFPTDHLPSPRWRLVGWIGFAGSLLYVVGSIFRGGELNPESTPGLLNPTGAPPELEPIVDLLGNIGNALAGIGLVSAAGSLIVRYRRADRVVAAQIRWLALVAVLLAASFIPATLPFPEIADVSFGLGVAFIACMPIAIGIAITRYRLYEIDRLINRALVYGALSAILAGVFTAAVGLAQRIFVAVTHETSDAAIVGATLVVATLYAPLRKRLEAVVDRRFKFDEARFGAYRDELSHYLALIDPERASRRLVDEAVRELGAVGGAVLDAKGGVVASSGMWPVEATVRLPLSPGKTVASLAIGPRPDGREHDPRHVEALRNVAGLAGAAMARRSAAR